MTTTKTYARVLTIAGSDSGGCAGIQADIKAASACGCFAASAITALTVQNTLGVRAVHIPPVETVAGQIDAVLEDIGADAVKLSMLPTAEIVEAVAVSLERNKAQNIVLDPVMVATSGDILIDDRAAQAIITRLLPMALLITPNVPEAEFITGEKITTEADFPRAAAKLREMGARSVLLKAGHLTGATLADHLFTEDGRMVRYEYEFIDTPNTHGTGCSLSSAIASYLALGYPLKEAVAHAGDYLHKAILAGVEYKLGHGHGPVHHFYKYWE
ncbi:MAG: bifunctional hydroxymethylpyrimidine kinase/phosphomethylpyrimidine kinase [Rikenellaceae bacterium]|jgi:hydroxymethylpyrimidine/phosphomethylpyrimidine kinase|nr:bifunctional hydroxymethylpyrimidine kinase/phosphomethylpyrimidine kinase [Rikenellaceae bacterium]